MAAMEGDKFSKRQAAVVNPSHTFFSLKRFQFSIKYVLIFNHSTVCRLDTEFGVGLLVIRA